MLYTVGIAMTCMPYQTEAYQVGEGEGEDIYFPPLPVQIKFTVVLNVSYSYFGVCCFMRCSHWNV